MSLEFYRKKYLKWAANNHLSPNAQEVAYKLFGGDFQLQIKSDLIDNVDMDGQPFGYGEEDVKRDKFIKYMAEQLSDDTLGTLGGWNYADISFEDFSKLQTMTQNWIHKENYKTYTGRNFVDDLNKLHKTSLIRELIVDMNNGDTSWYSKRGWEAIHDAYYKMIQVQHVMPEQQKALREAKLKELLTPLFLDNIRDNIVRRWKKWKFR